MQSTVSRVGGIEAGRAAVIAAFGLGVFVVSCLAVGLGRDFGQVAAIWPSDALAVAFIVRWTRDRREEAAAVVLAASGMALANLLFGSPPVLALSLPLINAAEIAACAWMLREAGGPVDSLKTLAVFVIGPMLALPAAGGVVAAGLVTAVDPSTPAMEVFLRWFSADGLGMAIIGAFALTLRFRGAGFDRRSLAFFILGQLVVLTGAVMIMIVEGRPPLFLLFPLLVIGALSHREFGGVTTVAVAATVAWVMMKLGHGPAVIAELAEVNSFLLMQVLLAAMVFTVLPVTALVRRLDAAVRSAEEGRQRAEELNALKTRLLAYVSHEIRSPLSGVRTLAELLRDGALGDITAEQRSTLAQIVDSGDEVDQLARDLTDAAAIQSGHAQVAIGEVAIGEALNGALAAAQFRISVYGAEVSIGDIEPGASVAADPLRLRQILVNLMVNAAKYGGTPPRIAVSARRIGDRVRFEVADNGRGVAPEQRALLFRDFERLGAERGDIDGAGLGLALSQAMAQLQGGRLGVGEHPVGQGGLFWVELPAWSAARAA